MALVLVTRPEPGASATAARLSELGHTPLVLPLSEIVPVPWERPGDPFEAVMFTSAQAPRHAGPALVDLTGFPAWCVGEATARAAREAGFVDVRAPAVRDGQALAEAMAGAGVEAALHLSGKDATAWTAPAPLRVQRRVVYAAHACGWSDDEKERALGADLALAYSPRGAALLRRELEGPGMAAMHLATLSKAVAEAAGPGWRSVAVAERPDEHALFAAAGLLCQNPSG